MANTKDNRSTGELVVHIRLVNFTLVITCIAVLLTVVSDSRLELGRALKDSNLIIDNFEMRSKKEELKWNLPIEEAKNLANTIATKFTITVFDDNHDEKMSFCVELRNRKGGEELENLSKNLPEHYPHTVEEAKTAWKQLRGWELKVVEPGKVPEFVCLGVSNPDVHVKNEGSEDPELCKSNWFEDDENTKVYKLQPDDPTTKKGLNYYIKDCFDMKLDNRIQNDQDLLSDFIELQSGEDFRLIFPDPDRITKSFDFLSNLGFTKHSEFSTAFPELNRFAEKVEYRSLHKIREDIVAKLQDSSFFVQLFGLKIPVSAMTTWGLLAIVIVSLYFLLHFWRLVNLLKINKNDSAWSVPWIGMYPGVRISAIFGSVIVLPSIVVGLVANLAFRRLASTPNSEITIGLLAFFVIILLFMFVKLIDFAKVRPPQRDKEPQRDPERVRSLYSQKYRLEKSRSQNSRPTEEPH